MINFIIGTDTRIVLFFHQSQRLEMLRSPGYTIHIILKIYRYLHIIIILKFINND